MTTILLVEDHPDLRELFRLVLIDAGFEVVDVETFVAAREWLAEHSPDAAVLDIQLPDGSGLDLARSIREARPDIPVILCSAHDLVDTPYQGTIQGVEPLYLRKPVRAAFLVEAVQNALAPCA